MRVLVFAHVPPPHHGQSVMVAQVLTALQADNAFNVEHVDARLSRSAADIGRVRGGKLTALLAHAAEAKSKARAQPIEVLYYFPAPAKRVAIYRDWIVMTRLRQHFPRLVLHWQAAGLGEWTQVRASRLERRLTQRLLGRADLSIVLGDALRRDAGALAPQAVAVVRNGIADPCPGFLRGPADSPVQEAVFLGACIREKGLFDAMAGIARANQTGRQPWRLTVAGDFADETTRRAFEGAAANSEGRLQYTGFVSGAEKHALLARAHALLFPTYYPAETQGLVVAEALAHDLPVVLTRWRAVDEGLPEGFIHRVEPRQPDQIAAALQQIAAGGSPNGLLRRHFLEYYTDAVFARKLVAALGGLARG